MTEKQLKIRAAKILKIYEKYKNAEEELKAVYDSTNRACRYETIKEVELDGTEIQVLKELILYSESIEKLDSYISYNKNYAEDARAALRKGRLE